MPMKTNHLRLAVSNIGFAAEEDEKVWRFMQRLGYEGLEIAPTRLVGTRPYTKNVQAQRKAQNLQDLYGLCIPSMQSIWFGQSGNIFYPVQAVRLADYTRRAVDFAVAVKCPSLVFGNPRQRRMREGDKQDDVLNFFAEICSYACQKGVHIALEANPACYGTNFCNTTSEAFVFASRVPGLKVTYDLGTLLTNNESLDLLFEHLDQVNHIHISEPELAPIQVRGIHRDLAEGLRKASYEGFVSVEMKTQNLSVVEKVLGDVAEVFG